MNDLKFAIQMEQDGERYYLEQAEKNKGNSLYPVCIMLAQDEKKHAQILTDKMNDRDYVLAEANVLTQATSVFQGLGDLQAEEKEQLSQLDFYRKALELEEKSIALYQRYLSFAKTKQEKELFDYLIGQEKKHFQIIDELVTLLRHAEEWVEDAEFGYRKKPY